MSTHPPTTGGDLMSTLRACVGYESPPVDNQWTDRDTMLYAVAVGSASGGPDEHCFVTENSIGVVQRVLPTYATVLGTARPAVPGFRGFELSRVVHGEHDLVCHGIIPPAGHVRSVSRITDAVERRGGGALIVTTVSTDVVTERALFTNISTLMVRDPNAVPSRPPASPPEPGRTPDHVVSWTTSPEQALIYRLTGDRHPLHSDPEYARRAGFDQTILHGLCAFGFAGRALLGTICNWDTARFGSISCRFRRPMLPGSTLRASIWREQGGAHFVVHDDAGTLALDKGRFATAPE